MGYTLTIGELEADHDPEDEYIRLGAKGVTLPDAPAFGEPTDNSNSRWPSYTAWHDFCTEAGIHELFYGKGWNRDLIRYEDCSDDFHRERPLLNEHPGAAPLNDKDAAYVAAALARFRSERPDVVPGFSEEAAEDSAAATLARLIWLDYWVSWAVTNCKRPVIANS